MPRRERWSFCQGATSDSVIVAIRGDRRNYIFLLVERRNMRGSRGISTTYVPTPLSRAWARTHVFVPEVPRSMRLGEALASHRSFPRFTWHATSTIFQLSKLDHYIFAWSRFRLSAQKCARYQKHVIPLLFQSVIRSTQQHYGRYKCKPLWQFWPCASSSGSTRRVAGDDGYDCRSRLP